MAKALYTKVNDRYFKINQEDVRVPTKLTAFNSIIQNANISTCDGKDYGIYIDIESPMSIMQTNKELADTMLTELSESAVTQMDELSDRYMISINYSIIDLNNNKVISRFESVEDLESLDTIMPQGIDSNNTCHYRRMKILKNSHSFVFGDTRRFGVAKPLLCNCQLKINDISVYQCTKDDQSMRNNSVFGIPFEHGCNTIRKVCDDKILLFSTSEMDTEYAPIDFSRRPKCVKLNVKVAYKDLIVLYDDNDVTDILNENIRLNEDESSSIIPETITPPNADENITD